MKPGTVLSGLMMLLAPCWAAAQASMLPAAVEPVTPKEEPAFAADSGCGGAASRALTAVGRLPPVRTVVFDPLTNSFGFVAPCADETVIRDADEIATLKGTRSRPPSRVDFHNRDVLDSRRLALTTQKIRLLIMPYNPDDGELSLEVTPGKGVEFEITPAGPAAAPPAPPPPAAKDPEVKAPEVKAPKPPPSLGGPAQEAKAESFLREGLALRGRKIDEIDDWLQIAPRLRVEGPERATKDEQRKENERAYTWRLLGLVKRGFELRRSLISKAGQDRREQETKAECVDRHIGAQARGISMALAAKPLRLAVDTTFTEVLGVARERTDAARSVRYVSCFSESESETSKASNRPPSCPPQFDTDTFGEDLTILRCGLDEIEAELDNLPSQTAELENLIDQLSGRPSPDTSMWNAETWKRQIELYRDALDDADEPRAKIEAGVAALRARLKASEAEERRVLTLLTSPALELQRANFPPLGADEAVTFTVRRGAKRDGDGDHTVIPARVNSLTLKSAPVHTVRFGTGVVASQLERPKFKLGPEIVRTVAKEGDGEEQTEEKKTKQVLFDDEGDGEVLPALFVRHYWGRRSPLLSRTAFERYMPAFSLGIPLAKAELLQEVLLGLTWEMVAGFDLNLGVHYAKVNALDPKVRFPGTNEDQLEVGDEVPSNVDVAALEKDDFKPAFYFGVVLTPDAFELLFDSRQSEK